MKKFKTPKKGALYLNDKYGFGVIPLGVRTKVPAEKDWPNRVLKTQAEIEERLSDDQNYGIVTEGLTVIDYDPRTMEVDESNEAAVETVIEMVKRFHGLTPTMEFITGGGGVHQVYVGEMATGRIDKGVDVKSGNASMVVGPGSIHPNGEPYWVFDDIPAQGLPEHLVGARKIESMSGETLEGEARIGEEITEGSRNDTLFRNLCRMREFGFTDMEVAAYAEAMNRTAFSPPLSEGEVSRIVDNACKFEIGTMMLDAITLQPAERLEQVDPDRNRLLTLDQLRLLPEPEYLVDRLLPRVGVGHIVGASYSGKTLVVLDLILSIASGRSEWFGREVKQAPTVYVALEGGFDLRQRVEAWEGAYGQGEQLPIWFLVEERFDLMNIDDIEQLRSEIKSVSEDIGVLVIDTQSLAAPSLDENDNGEMNKMMAVCKQLARMMDCLVLLVHHTGHGNSSRARGASSQYGAMEVSMVIEAGDGPTRTITMNKLKSGPLPDAPFEFRLREAGDSVVIEEVNHLQDAEEEILSAATEAAIMGATPPYPYSISLSQLREALGPEMTDEHALLGWVEQLSDKGLLDLEGDTVTRLG